MNAPMALKTSAVVAGLTRNLRVKTLALVCQDVLNQRRDSRLTFEGIT